MVDKTLDEKTELLENDRQQDSLRATPTRKDSSPSAFRKSAFLTVLVALIVYTYQVCIYRNHIHRRELNKCDKAGIFSDSLEVDEPYVAVFSRVQITADVPKQDAIVEAFKVISFNHPVSCVVTDRT